jgi:dTDP-4-dehydrorhamnose 3,5-epimerase-like enzyme
MRHIELIEGMKVTYCPQFGNWQKGIVKHNPNNEKTVFVVYKCNNEWDRYLDFTGEETDIEDLKIGWHTNEIPKPKKI